jgi:hypothetical protein
VAHHTRYAKVVVGHVTGRGFDLAGGPSITIGFDVTCLPARLTVDVGTLVTQALIDPVIHKGIDANWVLSAAWRF